MPSDSNTIQETQGTQTAESAPPADVEGTSLVDAEDTTLVDVGDASLADAPDIPLAEVQAATTVLFEYLKNVLYNPKAASLDPEQLPESFRELANGILYIGTCIVESRELANDLAHGNLDSQQGSRGNEIVSGLKNLQSTLKHISWQVGQVAKGDFSQQLSFVGALSESINSMIKQLKERDEALKAEIEQNQQMADEAYNSMLLLEGITKTIAELIIVVDRNNYEWLYTNHNASDYLSDDESLDRLKRLIERKLDEYNNEPFADRTQVGVSLQTVIELQGESDPHEQYFSVVGYPITWMSRKSMVLILVDVTQEQKEREALEQAAYYDTLTSACSRHFGMQKLRSWLDRHRSFVIAFVDIDGLKYVNDTFGHAIGDEYILATAEALSGFGEQAVLCRLGGDEFMVLVKGLEMQEVREQLEAIREQLESSFGGEYVRTFSFGLVAVDESNVKSASLLLSIADENMYEDKRSRKKDRRAPQ